jgi:hypothetical protein
MPLPGPSDTREWAWQALEGGLRRRGGEWLARLGEPLARLGEPLPRERQWLTLPGGRFTLEGEPHPQSGERAHRMGERQFCKLSASCRKGAPHGGRKAQ